MRTNVVQSLLVMTLLLLGIGNAAAQQAPAQQAAPPPPSKFKLMSSAYSEGSQIPTQYSCADTNASSPALQWSNPPAATVSFAVILHDTDAAPGKGTMDVTHWIFWNVPASSASVGGNVKPDSSPDGIMQGKNIRGVNGYQPPCPPPGATPHHYIFELYALDTKLDLPAGSSRADLLKAMDGHVIGKAAYVGLFGR
jgi:Raf kinase inhibitor-like YbhB/YbcL family protein